MPSGVKVYSFLINGIKYDIPTTYKVQRGMYLRVKKDGTFTCSAPNFFGEKRVIKFIENGLPDLLKRIEKVTSKEPKIGENYYYLLGEKVDGVISELELKKKALELFSYLTKKYEEEMGIKNPYKVRVRKMSTRYGSNSLKTNTITYNLELIHYSLDIITSVVVHELCHYFYRNHQKGFNKMLRTYCPDYDACRKKLIKGIYK